MTIEHLRLVKISVLGIAISACTALLAFILGDAQPCGPGGRPLDGDGYCYSGSNTRLHLLLHLATVAWTITIAYMVNVHVGNIRKQPPSNKRSVRIAITILLALAAVLIGGLCVELLYTGSTLT